VSDDQDWRLKAELDRVATRGALDRLLGRFRGPDVVREVGVAVPHDVVITHDGKLLYGYAANEARLTAARDAIEGVLRRDGVKASITVSHRDERLDKWLQVEPPLTDEARQAEEVTERDRDKVESRTMVASTGKLIRTEVEQTMREYAQKLAAP
jgi:hypothetical protein